MRRARAQVELAAGSRASVTVVGPPGSGRQRIAAAIHYARGAERTGSLVPLACPVLGAELVRSAVAALAAGKIAGSAAPQSTLLLNDADQLAVEFQAELAATLSSRSFPWRLIATARQPLDALVRRGEFHDGLASVLGTLVIELAPLAERREDLPLLAQLLLEDLNARSTKQLGGFLPEALDLMDAYPWPGNVDELAQVVAEAHKRAGGLRIGVADLPEKIRVVTDAAARPRPQDETVPLDGFLARVERELIRRALAKARGNKAKAARMLGMTRPRLYRRMVQLGLVEEEPGDE
jgi:DNA-binding NtrC family response regulator